MFTSIIEVTQQTNTNQVHEGWNKLLAPKKLMIQLHDIESEGGLTKANEAITICFDPPDIFKPDVLFSVVQHYLDVKTIPSGRSYKPLLSICLTGWVCTGLLSRLITAKVWASPDDPSASHLLPTLSPTPQDA